MSMLMSRIIQSDIEIRGDLSGKAPVPNGMNLDITILMLS